MQDRLRGAGRRADPVVPGSVLVPPGGAVSHAVLLGVDPSLRGTGYGVIRWARSGVEALAFGTVRCAPGLERSRCLVRVHEALLEVIREHRPSVCVCEGLFFAQNHQTTLIMGEARGAALVAAASQGLEIYEVAPRKVKQAVAGHGAAGKEAVARMIQRQFRLAEPPASDAADALAVALAFAQEQGRFSLSVPKRI